MWSMLLERGCPKSNRLPRSTLATGEAWMARGTTVPITPSVLEWAIRESGYDVERLAKAADTTPDKIEAWLAGSQPTATELRTLAGVLKRPFATFFLPRPPKQKKPPIEFRVPADSVRSELNVIERQRIREAVRLQEILAWIVRELDRPSPKIPRVTINERAETQAIELRADLRITFEVQKDWTTAARALRGWRRALENSGVFVLALSMGEDSIRGFSLWDEHAPLIALNTSWSAEARIFTLFHEYAHLLTRTSSACIESIGRAKSDPTERWCEEFAADVIIPPRDLEQFLRLNNVRPPIKDIRTVSRIANMFRASLRATTLQLIAMETASWPLYNALPSLSERKSSGGGGGAGRPRAQIRLDQYGLEAIGLFASAVGRDVLNRADVLDYLDIPPASLGSAIAAEEPYQD